MIVNGVTLPDIPENIINQYSHAMILKIINNGTEMYILTGATAPFGVIDGSLLGEPDAGKLIGTLAPAFCYTALKGATAWGNGEEVPVGEALTPLYADADTSTSIFWSDHDIYEATAVDFSTGEWTPGDIWFPFSLEWPAIPSELTAEYPYITIVYFRGTGGQAFRLAASKYPSFYGYMDYGSGVGMGYIVTQGDGCFIYATDYGDAVWENGYTKDEHDWQTITCSNTEEGYARMDLVWANHDIYKATSFDVLEGTFTLGTELYYDYVEPPAPSATRYSIGKAILDGVARQIMRLTDSTEKVKPEEFEPKLEGINIQLQELTVTATEEVQTITPPSGVYGFSKVIVEAVESSGGAGSGGEGDDAGDTSDTLLIESSKIFGYEWNYATSLYNGVLLPNPINWPYLLVYNTGTQYYINGANAPFVLDNGSLRTSDGSRCAVGTVTRKTALDANALSSVSWNMTFSESGYATKGKTLAVANHEVINKSNGSTYISPTGEIVASGEGVFAALPSDARYIVKKTTLDRLAFHIQKKMGTSAKLSVVDIDAYLDGL